MDIEKITASLKNASSELALQTASQKNEGLLSVSDSIEKNRKIILEANALDVKNARERGMSESLVERLSLDDKKIDSIIDSFKLIISQTDPVGEEISGWKTPAGMTIRQVRVPLGVVAIIYESRPNVTADAFALAYKSGNAILLRGSSSAINSNLVLEKAIKQGLKNAENGVEEAISLAPCKSHEEVEQILTAVGKVDVALPRGGAKLINMVVQTAKVPVIQTGAGICHLYVDESANLEMALNLAWNAKTQRPAVCNAAESLLVHEKIADKILPLIKNALDKSSVEIRGCKRTKAILGESVVLATDEDYATEYNDYIISVKVVDSIDEAIDHIMKYTTGHSESIVTENYTNALKFTECVDAAAVYVNASTRFTDGGEFGFGAEIGISTQKLHARGPMGLKQLTSMKYIVFGNGQIR